MNFTNSVGKIQGGNHMKEINNNELKDYGINTKHHIMHNGEKRFRLIGGEGECLYKNRIFFR